MLDIRQVQEFGKPFKGGLTPTQKDLPIDKDEVLVATFVPLGHGHAIAGVVSGEYYEVFLECLGRKEIIFCELYVVKKKDIEKCRVPNVIYTDQLLEALGDQNSLFVR